MSDIGITWDRGVMEGIISFNLTANDLVADNGLYTAVLISLFTDARAHDDDELPGVFQPEDFPDRRGWWGDGTSEKENDSVGSRLWLLERAKKTEENLRRTEKYVKEALQWMIDEGIASKIDVKAEMGSLNFSVDILRMSGNLVSYKFQDIWDGSRYGEVIPTPSPFSPLSLNPTAGFATHRMPGTVSTYIVKVRRIVAGDEVDVYDFQRNTNLYRLSSGGAWIDGSGETFYVTYWYDQSGNGNSLKPTSNPKQPELLLNSNQGWPIIYYDGVNHELSSIAGKTLANYITQATGAIIVFNAFYGTPWNSDTIHIPDSLFSDTNNVIGLHRGKMPVGGDDRVRMYNYDTAVRIVEVSYVVDIWQVMAWDHRNTLLTGYRDGAFIGSTASGNTSSLTGTLRTAKGSILHGKQQHGILLTYNSALSAADHLRISNYCKEN